MRAKNILPLAFLGLALSACTSDEVQNPTPGNNFADGGFVKLAINLPSQTANRAANDNFDDGLQSEYAVKNATLILFQGDAERTAQVHSAYDLSFSPSGKVNDQITTTSRIVQKVDNGNLGHNLYALVVLNDNGIIDVKNNELMVQGASWAGKTFGELRNLVLTDDKVSFTNGGILMANAALATTPGGTLQASEGDVHWLANVSGNVYKTEAEAQANPAANIYVERAVAKVTMGAAEGTFNLIDDDMPDASASVAWQLDGWELDVTNKSSYFMHVTDGMDEWKGLASDVMATPDYRFVGASPLKATEKLYRTYWGTDPNYTSFKATDFNKLNPVEDIAFSTKFGNDNPKYCFENTFDVANQRQDRTTQVVARVKVGTGETFYIVNNDKTKFYLVDGIKNLVAGQAASTYAIDLKAWCEQQAEALSKQGSKVTVSIDKDAYDVTLAPRDAKTGEVKVAGIKAKAKVTGADVTELTYTFTPAQVGQVTSELKAITEYTGGYAYYPIRIKHFGDDLTPWNTGASQPTAGDSYESDNAQRYLGRYGVLRNNWYELQINTISGLGSAVVPPTYGTDQDDELYNYISVRINVLSWAKRHQGVDL